MIAYELLGLAIDGLAELEDLGAGIYRKPEADGKKTHHEDTKEHEGKKLDTD